MPCILMRDKRMSLWQAKEDAGMEHGFPGPHHDRKPGEGIGAAQARAAAHEERMERAEFVGGGSAPIFMCGDFTPEEAVPCRCGYVSEFLCDQPMGNGKTCDLPLCEEHAHQIGEELHLCELHFREFQKKCGADQINAWPPRKT